MNSKLGCYSGLTRCIGFLLVAQSVLLCHGRNTTTEGSSRNDNDHDIDFELLGMLGVSHEFAEQFRMNLLKAIEAAKDEIDPLRQGEFGGISGGYFQGGAAGGGGGGNAGGGSSNQDEDEEEEEDTNQGPATPGTGPFGVLSGIFGIFSGLGTLNPSRILQSTVNFFPPGQRMQAQRIVDSLIGYVPPENRTARPRPRTRRPPTTPMTITDTMMKEATDAPDTLTDSMKGNDTLVDNENMGGANETKSSSVNGTTEDSLMSEVVIAAPTEPTTTEGFLNLHEILSRSTTPEPRQDEDDEDDFDKNQRLNTTTKPKSNSAMAVYKLKAKSPESEIESRGATEEIVETTTLPSLNSTSPSHLSSSSTTPI